MVYAEQVTEATATMTSSTTDGLVIFSIVLNVIIFAFGYGKLSNQVKNVSKRLDKQEEKLDRVAKSQEEKLDRVAKSQEEKLDRVARSQEEKMDRIAEILREKIDRVAEGLAELRGSFLAFKENIATQSSSPIVLTKYGNKVLQESGGEATLKDMFENLYPKFEGLTNPYDIQRKALKIVEGLIDKSNQIDQVKRYLYEESSVSVKTITDVLGLTLRDMVFERRGMPVKKPPDDEESESSVQQNKAEEKEKIRMSK